MSKHIRTQDFGLGEIDLNRPEYGGMMEYKPVGLFHKEDGSKDNKPSFVFVMRDCSTFKDPKHPVCVQITLEKLTEAMQELGYQVKKYPELPVLSE